MSQSGSMEGDEPGAAFRRRSLLLPGLGALPGAWAQATERPQYHVGDELALRLGVQRQPAPSALRGGGGGGFRRHAALGAAR